ncbi:MAG: 16S rRNA (cytidine(1402)-2'-O)-methyltransferase [Candidatus Pelagibacter sp.]
MHHDKILNKLKPGLYCVATPIGNLGDITLRALEVLKKCDLILCEDTRVSKKLLNHFKIKKQLISYHKFNEREKVEEIIKSLAQKKIICLISDAGTPTISDPGRLLIQECVNNSIDIFPIPGPSSVGAGISISGFSDRYLFLGFLPEKKKNLYNTLEKASNHGCTVIFFISPNKIHKIINDLKIYFPKREILICREITKFHEEYIRISSDNLDDLIISKKGEVTVIISENKNIQKKLIELKESDKKEIKKLLKTKTVKNVVEIICSEKKIQKKAVYSFCLEVKNDKI